MKQYRLEHDYLGVPQGTIYYGPYLITGGGMGYFKKEDIPQTDQGGTNCFFASAVESNPSVFKEIVNSPSND